MILQRAIVIICALLSGCATVTGTQSDCFSKYEKFAQAASCMRAEMPKLRVASRAPLSALSDYESYMNILEVKVRKGQLSDEDAKLQMQEYLLKMRAAQ